MAALYDPYSPEAMTDPRELYARLRAEDPVHYMPEYNAWAFASFDAVWQACLDTTNFSCKQPNPNAMLLGGAVSTGPGTFAAMDPPMHRHRRAPLAGGYTGPAVERDDPVIRRIARSVLAPLLADGAGELDITRDYAQRVAARVAGYKAGIPDEESEHIRDLCMGLFTREPGQKGDSPANLAAGQEAGGYLYQLVTGVRQDPSTARGDLAALLAAEVQGQPLSDEEIVADLMTLLITGSETTEVTVGATLYYLAQHADQLAAVLADPSLIPAAFAETIRYDHPTDFLCREVVSEVEVCGRKLEPGQGVLLLWGSACQDEAHFPNARSFDIHRHSAKSLIFGHGRHKCIGDRLAVKMGSVMLEEFLSRVLSFEVDADRVTRKYAEFVKGIDSVPVRFALR